MKDKKHSWNWKGGEQEYLNHSLMKRNRLIALKKSKGQCEVCGRVAHCIHHKDFSKINHSLKNLIVLCRNCHFVIHSERINKKTKFIREYGMTLQTMADKFGFSTGKFFSLHKTGKLKDFLKKACILR